MKKIILFFAVILVICAVAAPVSASEVREINALSQTVFPGPGITYVLKSDDSLWGWGANYDGRLGNGKSFESYYDFSKTKWIKPYVDTPYKILDNVAYFDGSDTWAIRKDDSLWVWGETAVALGAASDAYTSVPVKFMDNVVSFSVSKNPDGELIAYAVLSDGSLLGWGGNSFGELGNGTQQKIGQPTLLMEEVRSVQFYAARTGDDGNSMSPDTKPGCTYALKTDHSLWAWGFAGTHHHGLSGTGLDVRLIDKPVKVLENVDSFCGYHGTVAAITGNGDLYVWGELPYSVEGAAYYLIDMVSNEGSETGKHYYRTTPYLLAKNVKEVSLQINKLVYLTMDGTAYCWGQNGTEYFFEPAGVMDNVASLTCGYDYTLLLKQNGDLWAYGYDSGSQALGVVTEDRCVDPPQKVLSGVAGVTTNGSNTFAVKTDGNVWGVGSDVEHTLMGKGWQKTFVKLIDGVKLPYKAPASVITKRTGSAAIFRDVPQNVWYDKYLLNAYESGIIGGMSEGIYGPNHNLTHAQIMVMAANLHSLEKGDHYDFSAHKKAEDAWYQVFEDYCKEEGIIGDFFDGLEDMPVSRGQMACYFAYTLKESSYQKKHELSFSDLEECTFAEEIKILADSDIVGGYSDGTFRPDALVTRAEASVFVSNILDAIKGE